MSLVRRDLGVLLVACLAVLLSVDVMFADIVHAFEGSSIFGEGDSWVFAWTMSRVAEAISHGYIPTRDYGIFYPFGVSLAGHNVTIPNGILSYVLMLLGIPLWSYESYNTVVLLCPALNAIALFYLARTLGVSALGGLLVGFAIFCSPWIAGHTPHQINVATLYYLSLLLAAQVHFVLGGKPWRTGVAIVTASCMNALAMPFNMIYSVALFPVVFLRCDASRGCSTRRILFAFLLNTVGWFPGVWMSWDALTNLDYAIYLGREFARHLSLEPLSFLLPPDNAVWGAGGALDTLMGGLLSSELSAMRSAVAADSVMDRLSYLGVVGVVGIALCIWMRYRGWSLLLVATMVGMICSFGPELKFMGQGTGFVLPLVSVDAPVLRGISTPSRFSVVVVFATAIMIGCAFDRWVSIWRVSPVQRAVGASAVLLFMWMDLARPPFPLSVHGHASGSAISSSLQYVLEAAKGRHAIVAIMPFEYSTTLEMSLGNSTAHVFSRKHMLQYEAARSGIRLVEGRVDRIPISAYAVIRRDAEICHMSRIPGPCGKDYSLGYSVDFWVEVAGWRESVEQKEYDQWVWGMQNVGWRPVYGGMPTDLSTEAEDRVWVRRVLDTCRVIPDTCGSGDN